VVCLLVERGGLAVPQRLNILDHITILTYDSQGRRSGGLPSASKVSGGSHAPRQHFKSYADGMDRIAARELRQHTSRYLSRVYQHRLHPDAVDVGLQSLGPGAGHG